LLAYSNQMARVILFLAVIGVTIYAAIDCFRSDDAEIRSLPKPVWLLVIVALLPFGGLLWIVLGRQPIPGPPTARRLRTIAPDDDPDFLRSLKPPPRSRDGERRRKDGPPKGDDEDGETTAP
jgi:Phospholipase_D-nuclease N-terminal